MNKKILLDLYDSVLFQAGYARHRDTYARKLGNIFHLIFIQKSPYGGSCFINIGLYVDAAGNLETPPVFFASHLRLRLSSIAPKPQLEMLSDAYNFEFNMPLKLRSKVITESITSIILPYMERLTTIDQIQIYLKPESGNYAGITIALRDLICQLTGDESVLRK